MVLALVHLALALDAPTAMDVEDCGPSVGMLYPLAGATGIARDAVPTVFIDGAECGGLELELVLLANDEIVAERSVASDAPLVELDAELLPGTDYEFLVYVGGDDSPEAESPFSTGSRLESPVPASPTIERGSALMYKEDGDVYVDVTVAAVPGATVVGLAAWDGVGEVGDPTDIDDASAQRNLSLQVVGPQVGDEVCVGAMARGLDGTWSSPATECFVVTQGWSDEDEIFRGDDHDHACNAASAAMGLAPILLGTLGILRRRAR